MKEQKYNHKGRREMFRRILNKYTVTLLVFLVWHFFLDANSILDKKELGDKIAVLKKEKEYYLNKIAEDNRKMKELLSNRQNLEKFAREQYLMKKPEEDIFVIVND